MDRNFDKHLRALARIERRVAKLQKVIEERDLSEAMKRSDALVSALRRFQAGLLRDCVAQQLAQTADEATTNGAGRKGELPLTRLLGSLQFR